MKIKDLVTEDLVNYKVPSLFIISCMCDWKCCREQGYDISICQNQSVEDFPTIDVPDSTIFRLFHDNDITQAVVVGGLEPMLQFNELYHLIQYFRNHDENCTFVIYTGYYPEEILDKVDLLRDLGEIIIKYGRYIKDRATRFEPLLGVNLASDNQFAFKL